MESQFNCALATAEHVHEIRVQIPKCILENNYEKLEILLWSMNNELIGWYNKKAMDKDKTKAIEKFEDDISKLDPNSKVQYSAKIKEKLLKDWAREAISLAYQVWFAKEATNMFDLGDDD